MPPGGEWGRASIDTIAIGCSTCQMCCSRINHQIPIFVEFSISKVPFNVQLNEFYCNKRNLLWIGKGGIF